MNKEQQLQTILTSVDGTFDKKFAAPLAQLEIMAQIKPEQIGIATKKMKSFIHSHQQELIAAVVEEIEGKKKVRNPNKIIPTDVLTHMMGWYAALDAVLSALREK